MSAKSGSPGRPAPGQKARERQISFTRWLGLAFCTAGFVAIALGWSGMARVNCADCQLPYLLSGGATGIGLIVLGVALLIMAQMRADRMREDLRMGDLLDLLGRAPGTEQAGAASQSRVVAGGSSYHLPDCRLVSGKPDVELVTMEEAASRGLSPCRVCTPPELEVQELASEAEVEPAELAPEAEVEPAEALEAGEPTEAIEAAQPAAPTELPEADAHPVPSSADR